MRDFGKRFSLFLAFADRARRISEWDDSEHFEIIGNTKDRLDFIQTHKAHPIRTHSLGPSREYHRLDCTACIGYRKLCLLHRDYNCKRRTCDIGPGARSSAQSLQGIVIVDDDEMPWLTVHCAACQPAGLNNAPDEIVWHRCF